MEFRPFFLFLLDSFPYLATMNLERNNMTKLKSFLFVTAFAGLVAVLPLNFALAANPKIEVKPVGREKFKITVKSADAYRQVNLFYHQSDSNGQNLWNAIYNIGRTDRRGNFTTTRTLKSFQPRLDWTWYANVNGDNTPTITSTGSYSGR